MKGNVIYEPGIYILRREGALELWELGRGIEDDPECPWSYRKWWTIGSDVPEDECPGEYVLGPVTVEEILVALDVRAMNGQP